MKNWEYNAAAMERDINRALREAGVFQNDGVSFNSFAFHSSFLATHQTSWNEPKAYTLASPNR